jgi:uncharacterized membrane protein
LRGSLIVLGLACALVAHLGVEAASPALTSAGVALAAAVVLAPSLARGRLAAWTAALVIAGALAIAALSRWIWLPLYVPSVLGDAFGAWLFGHTLASGRTPLIERLVRRLHGGLDRPLEPSITRYTRTLTFAWTVLFCALGATSLALALFAVPNGVLLLLGFKPPLAVPQTAWSWFANVAAYGIAAGFFVLEYAYRRVRFPHQPQRSFLEFLRVLLAIAPSLIELESRAPRGVIRAERAE